MTIDERLERLTDRHQALTQSLELLHHDVQGLRAAIEADAQNIRALVAASQADGENIRALARIAEINEEGIEALVVSFGVERKVPTMCIRTDSQGICASALVSPPEVRARGNRPF